jgi:effector-binding domain-containing protein
METQSTHDFMISQMRMLNMPEISFFYVTSQPVAFGNLDEVLDPLLESLYEARRLGPITEAGPDIVRYYKASGSESNLYIMEVGISVKPETQPAGIAQVKTLPHYPCAGVLLWGGLAHIVQTYETLRQAMKEAKLQHTGEVRECTYSFESPVSPNNLMGIYMGVA